MPTIEKACETAVRRIGNRDIGPYTAVALGPLPPRRAPAAAVPGSEPIATVPGLEPMDTTDPVSWAEAVEKETSDTVNAQEPQIPDL